MFKTSTQACEDWVCPMMSGIEEPAVQCRGVECAMWRLRAPRAPGKKIEELEGYCGLAGEVQLSISEG